MQAKELTQCPVGDFCKSIRLWVKRRAVRHLGLQCIHETLPKLASEAWISVADQLLRKTMMCDYPLEEGRSNSWCSGVTQWEEAGLAGESIDHCQNRRTTLVFWETRHKVDMGCMPWHVRTRERMVQSCGLLSIRLGLLALQTLTTVRTNRAVHPRPPKALLTHLQRA